MNDNKLDINTLIIQLIDKAIELMLVKNRDRIYYINRLYTLLNLQPCAYDSITKNSNQKLYVIVSQIFEQLDEHQQNQLSDTREQAETRIIDAILPPPSIIECIFNTIKTNKSIKHALDWYYEFSKNTDYIKVDAIAKNQKWISSTKYGELEITINLSKPEKDPKEIARAKLVATSNFPKCLLCIENEGFQGNGATQPARHNHRMISINLATEKFYFQYSPYLYYDEHSIIINPQHKDMVVNRELFENFFAFTDLIPHYLIGSNTDIPIVGGSILTHDHYQAGNYVFPIEKATAKFEFNLAQFPLVQLAYLNWPVSTLKITGSKQDLMQICFTIQEKWYSYQNEALNIIADTDGQRHNAITPIMRKIAHDKYVVYLLLRNNRTSHEYPDGIFHPHAELHHIKKENIGLIEAMGLAILPGRLQAELNDIKNILLTKDTNISEEIHKHSDWIKYLQNEYPKIGQQSIDEIIQQEVGNRFVTVLEHAGVFKQNALGEKALQEFIHSLN